MPSKLVEAAMKYDKARDLLARVKAMPSDSLTQARNDAARFVHDMRLRDLKALIQDKE